MKILTLYNAFLLSICLLVVSCSKDLGNYDYRDINEIDIKGIENTYNVLRGIGTLRISPEINSTEEISDPARYNYLWVINVTNQIQDTIGKERNLEYIAELNPGVYTLWYRITDTYTNIVWWTKTSLNITTPYSRGILLTGEDEEGYAEAEMLFMLNDTIHMKNILSQSGLPRQREPVTFFHTSGPETYVKWWMFSRTGSYYLDRVTGKATERNNFGRLVYTSEDLDVNTLTPIAFAPQVIDAAGKIGNDYNRAIITTDGNLFPTLTVFSGGDFYTNPVNKTIEEPNKLLPAAPYLMYSPASMTALIWYDLQGQRFLGLSDFLTAPRSTILADKPTEPFLWNNKSLGRNLVYAENTRNTDDGSTNGNSFAILKDQANTHYVYKFYAFGAAPAKRAAYTILPIATDFDKADFYAFSSKRSVIFYSVGHTLYAYDYNPGNERIYQFPLLGTDVITMLKFDTQIDHLTNSLYIATYNSNSKGTLRRFIVGTNPNTVEITPAKNGEWTGLLKIKDMNWRAKN